MRTRYWYLAWLGCLALATPAVAQDEAPEPAPEPAEAAEPPAQPPADAAGAAVDPEEEEFIFSEEIPADQQVTFPVDI